MSAAILLPLLDRAACAGHPLPLWDDDVEGETPVQRVERRARGAEICATCPAVVRCEQSRPKVAALHTSGIWAGQRATEQDAVCAGPQCLRPFTRRHTGHRYCTPECNPIRQHTRSSDPTRRRSGTGRSRPGTTRAPLPQQQCTECEEWFTPVNRQQMYCTRLCGERRKNRLHSQRAREARIAAGLAAPATHCACGAVLDADARAHRAVYCSDECRRERNRVRAAARRRATAPARPATPALSPAAAAAGDPDRDTITAVIRGLVPLTSLPVEHRWIPVHSLRAQDLSLRAIALRVHCSPTTVRQYAAMPVGAVA